MLRCIQNCLNSDDIDIPRKPSGKTKQLDDVESAKIILMGNLRVGKTSIIKSYMENSAGWGNRYAPIDAVQGYEKVVNVG